MVVRDWIGLGKQCASKIIPLLFTGVLCRQITSLIWSPGRVQKCLSWHTGSTGGGETGLLLPTHTASLTYLDYSPNKNPNCILGTNENLGMGFCTSPFLPCLAPGFPNRWRVPLKWMHRFPCFAELQERQGTAALTGSETFFVPVSWAAGKPRRSHEAASHTCSGGGRSEEGERMKWGWASPTLDSLPA